MRFNKSISILALIGCLFLFSSAFATQSGDFTYIYTGEANTVEITGYTGSSAAVVIPDSIETKPVVSIGMRAFRDKSFSSVTIPESVTNIGQEAFYSCSDLSSVIIPGSVVSIGPSAFMHNGLSSVTISNGVKTIGDNAFSYCPGLTGVTIPDSVTSIGDGAFYPCTGLTSVTIGNSVQRIGAEAFKSCAGLTSITFPGSLTSIGGSAFKGCTGLTSINIPDNVTSIDFNAFGDCTGLTIVIIGKSVSSIADWVFKNCTALTSVYFNGNAPLLGADVFTGCANGFTVYYNSDTACSTGFTNPLWYGYPTAVYFASCTSTSTTTTEPTTTTTTVRCPLKQVLGEDNPNLNILRDFRDSKLANSAAGRKAIQIYYNNAESINAALEQSPTLKRCTQNIVKVIAPMMGNN